MQMFTLGRMFLKYLEENMQDDRLDEDWTSTKDEEDEQQEKIAKAAEEARLLAVQKLSVSAEQKDEQKENIESITDLEEGEILEESNQHQLTPQETEQVPNLNEALETEVPVIQIPAVALSDEEKAQLFKKVYDFFFGQLYGQMFRTHSANNFGSINKDAARTYLINACKQVAEKPDSKTTKAFQCLMLYVKENTTQEYKDLDANLLPWLAKNNTLRPIKLDELLDWLNIQKTDLEEKKASPTNRN
jgi:hypothetical protein